LYKDCSKSRGREEEAVGCKKRERVYGEGEKAEQTGQGLTEFPGVEAM